MFKFNLDAGSSLKYAVIGLALSFAPGLADAGERACDWRAFANERGFDHAIHRNWYRRFWTGDCEGLRGEWCFSGEGWIETATRIGVNVPPEEQAVTRRRLCALGRAIGYEWAKDNHIRKIDTDEVGDWHRRLLTSEDVVKEVAEIEAAVCRKIGELCVAATTVSNERGSGSGGQRR